MKSILQKAFLILAGMSIAFVTVVITGAAEIEQQPEIGRYRMTAIVRNGFTELFVIDTTNGMVKWVGKDEGKTFDQIKGN